MAPAGAAETASVLSFGAAIAGFSLGWSSLSADYTVNMPHDTPKIKIFLATYLGLNLPMILIETLGVMVTNTFEARPDWGEVFNAEAGNGRIQGGIGGLVNAILKSVIPYSSTISEY
jgi:purine-cytosine permease-like protein